MVDCIIGLLFVIGSGLFAYLTFHINEERKQGRTIPLIWEDVKTGKFDKQGTVKYSKGDNT
jgi:hypothetical protein|tara:strand:- start:688 stop:870 length:183 start_codon:yes stop_codon:yes gene_type:complete